MSDVVTGLAFIGGALSVVTGLTLFLWLADEFPGLLFVPLFFISIGCFIYKCIVGW
jgi:hypothetical protein